MPKRVYSAGDRDDDAESISNQSTSTKRTRKVAEDREIVRKFPQGKLQFYLFRLRMIFVKKSTMPYALINLKMVEFFVKISFAYRAKGISSVK